MHFIYYTNRLTNYESRLKLFGLLILMFNWQDSRLSVHMDMILSSKILHTILMIKLTLLLENFKEHKFEISRKMLEFDEYAHFRNSTLIQQTCLMPLASQYTYYWFCVMCKHRLRCSL